MASRVSYLKRKQISCPARVSVSGVSVARNVVGCEKMVVDSVLCLAFYKAIDTPSFVLDPVSRGE